MYLVILGFLLVLMKVADVGPVGGWSWWVVLVPFAGAVAWWSWADSTGWTQRRRMERLEDKKTDRRRKNLEQLGMDEHGRRIRRK